MRLRVILRYKMMRNTRMEKAAVEAKRGGRSLDVSDRVDVGAVGIWVWDWDWEGEI